MQEKCAHLSSSENILISFRVSIVRLDACHETHCMQMNAKAFSVTDECIRRRSSSSNCAMCACTYISTMHLMRNMALSRLCFHLSPSASSFWNICVDASAQRYAYAVHVVIWKISRCKQRHASSPSPASLHRCTHQAIRIAIVYDSHPLLLLLLSYAFWVILKRGTVWIIHRQNIGLQMCVMETQHSGIVYLNIKCCNDILQSKHRGECNCCNGWQWCNAYASEECAFEYDLNVHRLHTPISVGPIYFSLLRFMPTG